MTALHVHIMAVDLGRLGVMLAALSNAAQLPDPISVAQALLAADVVDELRLVIAPRIASRGRRLLDGLPPIRLRSIRSEISPTGYLLVDYRVIR